MNHLQHIGIGARIQYYREKSGYTQESFAELANLSPNYLSSIERGVKTPKLETFIRIANLLHVSSDALLQDVLETGAMTQSSMLYEQIKELNCKDQNKIFHVIDVMIKDAKE